jgi:hemerythrin-like metal-binding protein
MAANKFFVWKSEFELGLPLVDAEHQTFFGIANRLYEAMCAGSPPEMTAIATELKSFASSHFAREELLLEEMYYPGVEMQRKQHEWFARELENLPIASSSCDTLGFLRDWMLKHILGTDQQYVAWMATRAENPRSVS